jgi:hypothetical protein
MKLYLNSTKSSDHSDFYDVQLDQLHSDFYGCTAKGT